MPFHHGDAAKDTCVFPNTECICAVLCCVLLSHATKGMKPEAHKHDVHHACRLFWLVRFTFTATVILVLLIVLKTAAEKQSIGLQLFLVRWKHRIGLQGALTMLSHELRGQDVFEGSSKL